MTLETAIPLVVSTLGGAAVGVERQWSGHAEGEKARFAGLRTFTLLGLLGGIGGQSGLATAVAGRAADRRRSGADCGRVCRGKPARRRRHH